VPEFRMEFYLGANLCVTRKNIEESERAHIKYIY